MSSSHWTKVFFRPLKCYWNEALDNYRSENPGRGIGWLQFSELLAEPWMKTSTTRFAVAAFRSTEIYPFNPDVLAETALAPTLS
jgi:hypothetical protein